MNTNSDRRYKRCPAAEGPVNYLHHICGKQSRGGGRPGRRGLPTVHTHESRILSVAIVELYLHNFICYLKEWLFLGSISEKNISAKD